MKVGVIGCGMVSHTYCATIARAPDLDLTALASRNMSSAQAQAARYGGTAVSLEALLADPAIAIVVILAPPLTHYPLARRALEAGKHVYLEKPLATTLSDARSLLAMADARGLLLGCAPDTFLGAGHKLARAQVDDGVIGRVTGGTASFGTSGMEAWHPSPASFFAAGGGPLLDVGPYYVTQLVNLLGPVSEVMAMGSTPDTVRTATAPPNAGSPIEVTVPTSVAGALTFASGALVSLTLSWDVNAHLRPPLELYGDAGALIAPDPNGFGGVTRITSDGQHWTSLGEPASTRTPDPQALARGVAKLMAGTDPFTGKEVTSETPLRFGDLRGLGVLDLADAIRTGRAPRANGHLAYHVLETLLAAEASIHSGHRVQIHSRVERPLP